MSKSQFQKEYEEYKKYKEWQEMLGCKNAEEVIDFVMSNYLTEDEKCRTIADQAQQIKALEHRLSNCIEPKFKIGQEVWFIDPENDVSSGEVWKIEINCIKTVYIVSWGVDYQEIYFENELFATEAEAKAKLEELKNGN